MVFLLFYFYIWQLSQRIGNKIYDAILLLQANWVCSLFLVNWRQPCEDIPAVAGDFATHGRFYFALAASPVAFNRNWHLLPASHAMLLTATKYFYRADEERNSTVGMRYQNRPGALLNNQSEFQLKLLNFLQQIQVEILQYLNMIADRDITQPVETSISV